MTKILNKQEIMDETSIFSCLLAKITD